MSLGFSLGFKIGGGGGGLPALPSGYAFMVDENGNYLVDEGNNYLIVEI